MGGGDEMGGLVIVIEVDLFCGFIYWLDFLFMT